MQARQEIPLLPLHSVLFPGGPLPLRIFEPRYTDMVSHCMKTSTPFGVCLIRDGREVGPAARTFEVGTLAYIHDWHMRHDGILGITVKGGQRFKIINEYTRRNQLIMANVDVLDDEPACQIPRELSPLVDLLRDTIAQIPHRYSDLPQRYDDASWVGFRLSELLPLKHSQKQYFLQLEDPLLRLERLADAMEHLDIKV